MKKLILSVAVSLDGFIEGQGEYDWCFTDQAGKFDLFSDAGTCSSGTT